MRLGAVILAVLVGGPLAASAATYDGTGTYNTDTTTTTTTRMDAERGNMAEGGSRWMRGAEIFAGLGGGNYTSDLGNVVGSGLAWDARVGVQPWTVLGFEAAYEGLNGSTGKVLTPAGTTAGDNLRQHQFTVDAKAGFPIDIAGHTLRPYALAGLGYARLNADSGLKAAGLDSQNLFAVPVGAGVSYDVAGPFAVDGRFTYNIFSGIDQPLAQGGDSWTAIVNLGAQFGR